MSELCRPLRRLFLCALVLLAREGLAQTVPMTTVQDTVYRADGSPAQGTLLISWPEFTTSGGQAIAAGTTSVTLGAGGALSVALVSNANATPPSTVYTVVYQLNDGTVKTEYWIVPTTSPATLAAVRATLGATSSVAQMATQQFVNSALATKANDSAVVHLAGAETITGVKQFAVSPSLPSPVQPTDAASKSYVDSAVQNVGSGSYLSTSGGTLTGPLTLSGDPVAPNQAVTKHYTDISVAVKADLIGGLVPPTELASGTPSGSTCLLGNQTWGSCGAGGSSSYINNTLIANPNFNSATPSPQTNFLNCSFQNTGSDVSLQCPYGNTSSTFALGSQAVLNNQANTYGAGLQDFSAASLRLPSGAGYAPATSAAIGFDTTANAPVINISGVTQQLALTTSNISGQASTALALAATPAQCNGSFATGIQANGNANCTTAGVIQLAETSQPAGIPNYGIFWFDSTTHTPRIIDNNGQVEQLALLNVFNTDANTLEEYNGTNPQTFNLYGTRTDASDYERARLGYDTADSYFFLGADAAGTGTQRGLGLWLQGSLRWVIDSAFNFKPWSDNIKDIGTPTLRVHNLYLGTGLVFNSGTLTGVHGTTGVAAEAGTLGTTAGAGLCNDGNGNITDQGCTSGAVSSVFGRSGVVVPQSGDYSVSQVTGAAPLASPAFSGTPTAPTQSPLDNSTKIATTAYTDSAVGVEKARAQASEALLAPLASPALTGTPTTPTPSTSDNSTKIATTAYVQNQGYASLNSPAFTGSPTAPTPAASDSSTKVATTAWVNAQGYGTATGNVSGPASSTSGDVVSFNGTNGRTIQDSGVAVSSLAPLNSAAFTGTPTAPTAAQNDNTTRIATDAFVLSQASSSMPLMNGTAVVGMATTFARADHVHPTDSSRAALASPAFTGTPTAPTPATTDNSQSIATTAYVQNQGYATLGSPQFTGTPTAPTPSTSDSSTKIATTAWVNAQGYGTSSGNVSGPASSTSGDIASFNGTTGKSILDSGVPIASVSTLPSAAGLPGEYMVSGGTSPDVWSPWALDGMALPGATLDQQWNLCNTIMLILGGGTCNFTGVGAGVYPNGNSPSTATIAAEMFAAGLPAPALSQSSGGSLTATATYQLMTTYINAANSNHTVVSKEASITLTGSNATITVTSPTTFSGRITSALATQYGVWMTPANGSSGSEVYCGAFTLGTNATISANCSGAAKSGQGEAVAFLLPPSALWNVTITDGASCGIEAFDAAILDSRSSGITQGLFLISSSSGSTNVNALICTDQQSARGVGRVIRMRGVRVRNTNGATMSNAQSAAFVIGGNGGNLVDGGIFSGIGAAASTGTAMWVANVCCNDLFEFLQLNGMSNPAGGQPLHIGDGASVTRGVTFLSTTAVNPGNGLNNIFIGGSVQGVSFAGATYMEGSKQNGCDTTNNFIEVNGPGDSVSFDTTAIGGGCNSVSTASVSGNGTTATATVSGFNWGPGYTSGVGITVSACGSFNGSYSIASGGSGTTSLTFSSSVNATQNSCTVSLTNGNTQYVYDITNAAAFKVNQVPTGAGMQNLINDHVNSKTKTGSANQVLGQYSFGNAGTIFGGSLEVVGTFTADAGGSFSGTVTAPTVATSDNSTKVATTAYVQAQGYAPLSSPAFTGTPTSPTPSPGDSSTKIATTAYVQGQTIGIPWLTLPRAGANSGVTFSTSTNQAYWWGIVLTFPVTTTQVTYYVGTVDNTANSYDIGIYDSSGNLRVHTGSKAGTTFAPAVGAYTLAWASSATLQPGRYYLAITTNCTASCAALAGDNASAVTFLSKAAVSVTTGGTLNGPITPPADAWNFASYVPAWAVH
jgi:hypothetical protein